MMQSYIIFFVFQIKYVLLHMIGNNENDKNIHLYESKILYSVLYQFINSIFVDTKKNKQCIYEKNCNVDSLYGVCSFWIFSV